MSNILSSWSGMRKYLEQEMLADCLQGRIRYGCMTYVGMDGCKMFELCIDGEQVKRFSLETVNTYFINNGFKENTTPIGKTEYWHEFWQILDSTPIKSRTEYTDKEFCDALAIYRNQDVQTSIYADNPLIRMFAVLDKRIGKRTLVSIKDSIATQPEWLQRFYRLRIDAETAKKHLPQRF